MNRSKQRKLWLDDYFKAAEFQIRPASEDASFRSYFRINTDDASYILMDAPPEHENCMPFVVVQQLLAEIQVNVPKLFAVDLDHGFILLSDFGETLYLTALIDDRSRHQELYQAAIDSMLKMQNMNAAISKLPPYDNELLVSEMQLFTDWFVGNHLGVELDANEVETLTQAYTLLSDNAQQQPQVAVHRDYHSRNLMVVSNDNPGVIDFQDAVYGPLTYDLASLLKDCYIDWSVETIEHHCRYFMDSYNKQFKADVEFTQLMRWFDLMAAQRHLKAIGIFCRLNYRDDKPGYLHDIPRTMNYLLDTAAKYPELNSFSQLLQDIQPVLPKGPTNL